MSDTDDRTATSEAHTDYHWVSPSDIWHRTLDLVARNRQVMLSAQLRIERARAALEQYRALVARRGEPGGQNGTEP